MLDENIVAAIVITAAFAFGAIAAAIFTERRFAKKRDEELANMGFDK